MLNSRPTRIAVAAGGKGFELTLDPASRDVQRLALPEPVATELVRITVLASAKGARWAQVAISEVSVLAR